MAQEFQGLVTYKLSYELPGDLQAMASILPNKTIMMYRDNVSKSVTDNEATGGTTIVYTDNETGETLMLMNTGKDKFAIKNNFKESEEGTPEYKKTGEKKEIAGYSCEVVETEYEGTIIQVCYTKELPNIHTENSSGLEGFPLEIVIENEQMTRTQVAVNIQEGAIEELTLEIPDGYQLFTKEEWLKKMQAGMSIGM